MSSAPDTIINGDKLWEWVGFSYLLYIKTEDLDYITSAVDVPGGEDSEFSWSVFPNPSSSVWTVQAPGCASRAVLSDAVGNRVYQAELLPSQHHVISTNRLSPGLYVLILRRLEDNLPLGTRKLILLRE
jgi:hypothetical protein